MNFADLTASDWAAGLTGGVSYCWYAVHTLHVDPLTAFGEGFVGGVSANQGIVQPYLRSRENRANTSVPELEHILEARLKESESDSDLREELDVLRKDKQLYSPQEYKQRLMALRDKYLERRQ